MRVLLLTNFQGNQLALANKLAGECEIAGIVFSRNIPQKKPSAAKKLRMLLNRAAGRTAGKEFVDVWFGMLAKYSELYPETPAKNVINVENVNDAETLKAIDDLAPDLVVVSGTNLVGRKVIEAAQKRGGIVNLHTGISPYVKGGPNCTNWCLAKNWFHLIGNTVMWLDAGIDTGNIIATEQTPLSGDETLFDLHWKVMEHAHSLYVEAIRRLARGEKLNSVPQKSIAKGSDFYSADWGLGPMRRASANFRRNYRAHFSDPAKHRELSAELKLFPFTDQE
jgi:methionyl-tRNA formyltransferase